MTDQERSRLLLGDFTLNRNEFPFWQSAIDPMYRETLEYCHPGKDIDQAIRESFGYLSADPHRLNVMEPSEFKRFVNGWLSKMRNVRPQLSLGERKAQERKAKGL